MKIINFGSLNIDYVYQVSNIVSPGETIPAGKIEVFPGGKGLNQSVAAARAGAAVLHAGAVGSDGQLLTSTLAAAGIDCSKLLQVSQKSGHAVIQVDAGGQNAIIVFGGSNQCLNEAYIDQILELGGPEDIVLLQNEVNAVETIIRHAHNRGLRVAFNPSPFPERPERIPFALVDFLIVNEIEGALLASLPLQTPHRQIVERLHGQYPGALIVLTCGDKGALCQTDSMMISQEAFSVNPADTTAAGDTFCGYFLAGICRGISIEECMRMASAASAVAVSRPGAVPSIPLAGEVKEFLRE